MPIRLLHAADLHLGMKFTGRYPPEVRDRLIKARLETLHNLVKAADDYGAAVLVMADDLFHDHNLPRRDIRAAAEALNRVREDPRGRRLSHGYCGAGWPMPASASSWRLSWRAWQEKPKT